MGSFDQRMEGYIDEIDNYLEELLPKTTIPPVKLHEAMHYAVINGVKGSGHFWSMHQEKPCKLIQNI